MRTIYILLTHSTTLMSQAIALTTGAAYTHVSICLSPELDQFYSFARRLPHFPLPAGLVCERPNDGYWARHPGIPCALFALPVEDKVHAQIKQRLNRMCANPSVYHYSLLGVLLCAAGIIHRRQTHYFCSQFVGELLADAGAVSLPRDASLLHPDDFATLPSIRICYSGRLGELSAAHLQTSPFTVFPHYDKEVC